MSNVSPAVIRRRNVPISPSLAQVDLPEILKHIYANRGVDLSSDLFLTLDGLHRPDTLKNIDLAASLLADAVEGQARVLIVGDFDSDGATSCAMAVAALAEMGLQDVSYLVPNRFEFGYGLTPEIVSVAAAQMPDLIVTVDNGISSCDGVASAQLMGISVLITDHHLPGPELPAANVIVNPNQPGCKFPSKVLAGVGVFFYVLIALRAELKKRCWFLEYGIDPPKLADFLDLVALGTIADVVPLDKNNRILVGAGLARIRSGRSQPGVKALFQVAGRAALRATASDLGFFIGPRLNAAGRLDDISLGVNCLLAKTFDEALPLAQKLQELNNERKDLEQLMKNEALKQLEKLDFNATSLPFAVTLYNDSWHQGVIGILASRIRQRIHRPVMIFADAGNKTLKGSGRSIPGLHLRDVLERVAAQHPTVVRNFGGHAMAVGMTLSANKLEPFREAFEKEVSDSLNNVPPELFLESDGPVSAKDLNLEMAERLALEGPWGQEFPEPRFDDVFKVCSHRILGDRHLKLLLETDGIKVDAIAFNIDIETWLERPLFTLGALYRLSVNDYRSESKIELIIDRFWPI